jgi:phosphoglycolate phosphatase-like HAD superfamily hydrolase
MLAIFDNDGTICDTQNAETGCFVRAIQEATGKTLEVLDWTRYEEATGAAIVRGLLVGDPAAKEKEEHMVRAYVGLLREVQPKFPGDFQPLPGAVEFISRLKQEGICSVAIASGGFEAEARFKLGCCGINLDDFPHATSSDTPRRRDIVRLAATRAGFDLSSVVFFGDGAWDVQTTGILGIPMIGIGRKLELLRSLGVRHRFRDFSDPDAIIGVLRASRGS